MKKSQAPERIVGGMHEDFAETHPAFGCCVVANWTAGGVGRGVRLFGSDLLHNSGVSLTFYEAHKARSLSSDRHVMGHHILQVDLSAAQWSRLVSASGIGNGVPVTITSRQDGPLIDVPAIAAPEASKKELHGQEMADALKEHLEAMSSLVGRLGAALEGTAGKRELREVHKEMARHVQQLPGSVQFVHEQFARATEKLAEDAKVEVEAHVAGVAQMLGLDSLARLPSLPNHQSEEKR